MLLHTKGKGSTSCTASRNPDTVLMSLLSVALSPISVKQFYYIILGTIMVPLKIKLSMILGTFHVQRLLRAQFS